MGISSKPMARRFSACFMATLVFACPCYAQIDIGFGLDSGTRNLIQSLPANIRQQIETAVANILPEIDKSVLTYEDHLNSIIHDNIDQGMKALECAADGTVENIKSSISGSLAGLFFSTVSGNLTPKDVPGEFKSLDDAIEATRAKFTSSTKANDIAVAYADLLHYTAIVRCTTQIAGAPVAYELWLQAGRIYYPALEWMMLVGDPDHPFCVNADDCFQKRKAQIQQIIKSADPRDVAAVQADQIFAKIPAPPQISFLQQIAGGHIDILSYEVPLGTYRQIERSIAGEMALRLKKAQDAWKTADSFRQQAQTLARNEVAEVNSPTSNVDFQNAIQRYPILNGFIKSGLDAGKSAATLDPSGFTDKYNALTKEMATYSANSECMNNKAKKVMSATGPGFMRAIIVANNKC
jgi:hypothetical protein